MAQDQQRVDGMSAYEARAWKEGIDRLQRGPRQLPVPKSLKALATKASGGASRFADTHLPTEEAIAIAKKVMDGTFSITFIPALQSASVTRTLRSYQKEHGNLIDLGSLRTLDLEQLDRFKRHKNRFVATAGVQGGITGVSVTGTEVATVVSRGITAGTVVAAIATDTVASLALMGRAVGSIAVRYGYDVKLPREELYAVRTLSLGTASSAEAKYAAIGSLSRLTQDMMRQKTWKELNEHLLTKLIRTLYESLGLRLTKRKLAQAVPVAGVLINGGLSAQMIRTVYDRAELIYRLRFLADKYGLDTGEWMPAVNQTDEVPTESHELDAVNTIDQEQAGND